MALDIALHIILLIVGTGAFFLGIFSIFHHSRMFREFYNKLGEKHDYSPSVSILAPVASVDKYFRENVESLLAQEYPHKKWEILFVVDKGDRITENEIKRILRENKVKNARIIQSIPLPTCSGKSAAMMAGAKKARYEVIASWDADAKVSKDWLASLVGPLDDKNIGATTGYRFYVSGRNFSSYILSLWNMLGFLSMKEPHTFAWGGSFAIKKKTIEKLGILRGWTHAIAEDVIVTESVWKAGLRVYFVPSCTARSRLNTKSVAEFTTRQITIVRWNRPAAYKAMFGLLAFTRISTLLGAAALYLFIATGNVIFALESFLLLWYLVWSSLRASLDFRNFRVLLGEDIGSRAKWVAADFFAQWLAFYSFAAALRRRTITWHGRTYDLTKGKIK